MSKIRAAAYPVLLSAKNEIPHFSAPSFRITNAEIRAKSAGVMSRIQRYANVVKYISKYDTLKPQIRETCCKLRKAAAENGGSVLSFVSGLRVHESAGRLGVSHDAREEGKLEAVAFRVADFLLRLELAAEERLQKKSPPRHRVDDSQKDAQAL